MALGFLRKRLPLLYGLGAAGALLQVWGGYWDVSWHFLGIVETFLTPPHTVLYAGIAVAGLAGFLGVLLKYLGLRGDAGARPLFRGLEVSFLGTLMQGAAGPLDLWWHAQFGFDPFLFTPAHSLLILGGTFTIVGIAIGTIRIRDAVRAGTDVGAPASPRILEGLVVVALACLWLGLNGVVHLLTNVEGIAYTFGLSAGFVSRTQAGAFLVASASLAFTGTSVILAAKRVLAWRGASLAVAGLVAGVMGSANLGFRAWTLQGTREGAELAGFLLIYAAFLIPILLFDILVEPESRRRAWLLSAAALGPFASFLDGWYSSYSWTPPTAMTAVDSALMVVAGILAGLLISRFEGFVLLRRRAPAITAA